MTNNLEYCDCGSKGLNLVNEQIDDFWEAHADCYYEFEYIKPKGSHSDHCPCGDQITAFPDDWYSMWTEVHDEHKKVVK